MPYITKGERVLVQDCGHPTTAGQLNYMITVLCDNYLHMTEKKYRDYNEIIGVLESAKLEFYRRQVAFYEDDKLKTNGEVYFG